jgi:hypothetical protein
MTIASPPYILERSSPLAAAPGQQVSKETQFVNTYQSPQPTDQSTLPSSTSSTPPADPDLHEAVAHVFASAQLLVFSRSDGNNTKRINLRATRAGLRALQSTPEVRHSRKVVQILMLDARRRSSVDLDQLPALRFCVYQGRRWKA